ncbi:peptidylprolyl isomerase [Hyphomonas sp.]|uniref:peptidylprolyl isomerase n=1 Tax=Hyphomonas sp. TaxID=87 RepID=UPI0025BA7758|nr:peptidylprolyl isomerase [Hyphomonas sp.]
MRARPLILGVHLPVLAALAVLGSVAGCEQTETHEAAIVAPDETVAAYVNGEPVFTGDVELEAVARGLINAGQAFGSEDDEFRIVLDQLVDQKLMAQEARRRALDRDPASLRRLEMAQERILGNLLVESLVSEQVTEAAIDRMYGEQVRLQQANNQVSVAHILVDTRDEADALYKRIEQGDTFESLVFNHSKDTRTRMENGDLGFVAPNDLAEPFPVVIANTPVGEVSPPFQTAQGWHILKVKDRRTEPPKSREEMRPEIATFLTLNEVSRILRRLRTEATIEQGSGQKYVPTTEPGIPAPVSPPGDDL